MKISIIIPCHNVEKYVDRCLDSIKKQTIGIDKLEIILIDDASTDNTLVNLRNFEKEFENNTIIIICQENVGAAAARNIGLNYATGDYITFIDADDFIADCMLERLINVIVSDNSDMAECNYHIFSELDECKSLVNKESRRYDLSQQDVRRHFIINYGIKSAVWGRVYRADYIHSTKLRFLEGAIYEDVHFSAISFLTLTSVSEVSDVLYFYYINENGITQSSNFEKLQQEVDIFVKTLEELEERNLLNDVIEKYYKEIEYYCIQKCFIDPLSVLKNDIDYNAQIYFKEKLLELFPNASENSYALERATFSQLWKRGLDFLKTTEKEQKAPILTVKIIGGLGNQMRCYIAGYIASKITGLPLTLDITDFYLGYFRQFLLDYLNIPETIRIWHPIDIPLYSDALNLPKNIMDCYDLFLDIDEINDRYEFEHILEGHRAIYIYGYDENHIFEKNLADYKDILQPRFNNYLYSYFVKQIENQNSVSVHIRRTDFISLDWNSDENVHFYFAAMNYLRKHVERPHFYIFSDDMEWTRKQFTSVDDCSFVDSFGGEVQSLYDMFCMASCKYHILTNKSTYSKWASLLCSFDDGFSVCQSSESPIKDKEDYSELKMIFLERKEIEEYSKGSSSCVKNRNNNDSVSISFDKIESEIVSNNFCEAMDLIDHFSVSNIFNISQCDKERLIYYRAIILYKTSDYAMALDSFRTLRGKRVDYDFLYYYASCLELTEHHIEAICYASIAKCLCCNSDIDNLVLTKNEDEKKLWDIFQMAFRKLCKDSNRALVFLTNSSPYSINKQIVSIRALFHFLGFKTFLWRNGMDSLEKLKPWLTKDSIVITNVYENCFDLGDIELIIYMPISASDVDRYFTKKYTECQLNLMQKNAKKIVTNHPTTFGNDEKVICAHNKAYEKNYNFINESLTPLYTWDTYVNDEESIWQTFSIINGILEN